MKTVLVALPEKPQGRHRELLETAGKGCRFLYCRQNEATEQLAEEAEVIIGNVPPRILHAPERLELLQLASSGADRYIAPGLLQPRTLLACAIGAYSQAVAEHSLAVLLMLQKKLHLYRDMQLQHRWAIQGMTSSLSDSTVLVVGLGEIGSYFARMCKALGAHVIGVKRRLIPLPEGVDELYPAEETDRLLPRADVVVSFLPDTPETRGFYTARRVALMKPGAIFLNSGRGGAISSEVLHHALTEGPLSAAGIDVAETEPLPPESPLWALPNLLITPHIAGFFLPETLDRIVEISAENLAAFLEGRPLRNLVDPETGYRI
ncbi:MAG: D-2-hydroxyacid dehydrogenase [Oscillospiraceae bacterium]